MDVAHVIEGLHIDQSARIACPDCSKDRSKRNEKDLAVHRKKDGYAYYCHHCTSSGFVRFESKFQERKMTVVQKQQPMPPVAMGALEEPHLKFLEDRGISAATAEAFKLFATDKYFGRMNAKAPALGFPYYKDGKLTSAKYRALESKEFTQDQGGAQDFFGLDKVDPTQPLIIVEGEMDALAAFEAGIANVVSVPAGAPMKVKDGRIDASEDAKFSFVWNSFELLKLVPYIIIATDNDTAGQALAEELARRIGKARCRLATLVEKDINDLFLKDGADAVKAVLDGAEPYPVAGLSQPSKYFDRLNDLWTKGTGEGTSTGYSNVDEIYTVGAGQLTVVTGYPSSGKSNFVDQLMVNLAGREDWKFAICSFENQPDIHISRLMELHTRRRFFEGSNRMSDVEKKDALKWVDDHFLFLDSETVEPSTIESILERASIAVARLGIRGLVIDPYNYIENRSGVSETEFISSMLTRVQAFAKAFGVHVWFVAHPAKITRSGMDLPRPDGMSISGCYSSDTEVLTDRGWVNHSQVNEQDEVACFDLEKGSIQFEKPEHVHVYPHNGVMHHWTGSNMDMLVTPNHRMVVKPAFSRKKTKGSNITGRPRTWDEDYQFCKSEDLSTSRWAIPTAGVFADMPPNKSIDLDSGYDPLLFWWYVGFWVAEGHVSFRGLSVCQVEDNSHKPRQVIKSLGLKEKSVVNIPKAENEKPLWVSRVYQEKHPELCEFVAEHCGSGCANKILPNLIWDSSIAEMESLLDGLMFGDGSINGNIRVYHTTSPRLADDVQRLAIRCGYWAHISSYPRSEPHHKDKYAVIIRRENSRTLETVRNRVPVKYKGKVYCLTVSTGAYITRRNGKMAICGNSMAWWAKADCGLTVHRTEGAEVQVAVWKCRYRWVGTQGETTLVYNKIAGNYTEPSAF